MPGKFSKVQLNLSHQADDETKYVDVIFVWPLPFWMLLEFSETNSERRLSCGNKPWNGPAFAMFWNRFGLRLARFALCFATNGVNM